VEGRRRENDRESADQAKGTEEFAELEKRIEPWEKA